MPKPLDLHRSLRPVVSVGASGALRKEEPLCRAGARHRSRDVVRGTRANGDLGDQPRRNFGTSQILRPGLPAIRASEDTSVGGPRKNDFWIGSAELNGGNGRPVEFRRDGRPMAAIVGSKPQPAGSGPHPERLKSMPEVSLHNHDHGRLCTFLIGYPGRDVLPKRMIPMGAGMVPANVNILAGTEYVLFVGRVIHHPADISRQHAMEVNYLLLAPGDN